ncbi:MAG: DUF2299 family protein [Desulfurococcaceae archaeon]
MNTLTGLKDLLSKWLIEENFIVTQLDTTTLPRANWGLNVATPGAPGVKFAVISPADKPDRVVLVIGIAISPEHRAELEKLKQTERIKVMHSILSRALMVCNDCKVSVQPSIINPHTITINLEIFGEEIEAHRKPLFIKQVVKLINTYLTIVSGFNEWFPVVPQPGKEAPSGLFI